MNGTELEGILSAYRKTNELVTETKPKKKNAKIGQLQVDKAMFQGVANVLWGNNSNLTQAEIICSEKMEFYRMHYKGKNTLRDWLREIDPRPKESRRGRPKKYPST